MTLSTHAVLVVERRLSLTEFTFMLVESNIQNMAKYYFFLPEEIEEKLSIEAISTVLKMIPSCIEPDT